LTLGLSRTSLQDDIVHQLRNGGVSLAPEQAEAVARAVAAAIEKNNQEIDRELGRRIADIERKIGRG
jgi:hypothetical protein